MKKSFYALFAAAALTFGLSAAEETRTIRLIQDDAQVRMATKSYTLKHVKASDIRPFVLTAIKRYYNNSQIRALNFSAANQQNLIVTTAEKFIPYVDQIIATLDRGTKKDAYGSAIAGSGSVWKVYHPSYRTADSLLVAAGCMLSGNGNSSATSNGAIWIKDDIDNLDYAFEWLENFDRPIPQVSVKLRYYAVRESTLRDVGIDYLSWKNGPGMNLFDFAFNSGRIAWDKMLNAAGAASSMTWSYGGFMTAPAFDLSFLRLLQQSGEAKIVASADLTVLSGKEAEITLEPALNAIVKDENDASAVSAIANPLMKVRFHDTFVNLFADDKEINEYGWIPRTPEFYKKNKGCFGFGYTLETADAKEANNIGDLTGDSISTTNTGKTVHLGTEQLLASLTREYDVEQTTGIPFLCQIPVLKYIFGTTTTIKEKNLIFVTIEANLVQPAVTAKK